MSDEPLFSMRNRWFVSGVGITVVVFVVSALAGFVVLPYKEPNVEFSGLWDMICSAAGIPRVRSEAQPVVPGYTISTTVLSAAALRNAPPESVGRGATLAQQCAICHGPIGISRADSPNLAGQYASAIYKQLKDFHSGARVNAIMSPFALRLSEQDMIDLASYYAYLPRLPTDHSKQAAAPPRIVVNGAPMRGIAPCGACHGGIENKAGSPWLEGQPAAYIKSQLLAFVNGTRKNDISEQMRNIAREMAPEEIEEAAAYFSAQPPEQGAAE